MIHWPPPPLTQITNSERGWGVKSGRCPSKTFIQRQKVCALLQLQPQMSPILPFAAVLLLANCAIGGSASSTASRFSIRPRHKLRGVSKDNRVKIAVNTGPDQESNYSASKETVSTDTRRIFQGIYKGKGWSEAGRGSGAGSTREATQIAVSIIRLLAAKYNVSSMVDAPCGEIPQLSH